jgi:ubiquinone/menaquinone biosynthesis C-methylase UbiE
LSDRVAGPGPTKVYLGGGAMSQFTGPGLDLSAFAAVDAAAEPHVLLGFLDQVKMLPTLQGLRPRMVELLQLPQPALVLDAGCGLAGEAMELAQIGGIEVVGVDASHVMIEEARRRVLGTGLPVSVQQADTADLPFPDDHFHACQAQTLFAHVADPVPALAELTRVTRPGGRIAVLDIDLGTTVVDHPDATTTAIVLQAYTDGFANGRAGRQFRRLMLQAGLHDVTVELTTMELHPAFLAQQLTPTIRRLRDGDVVAADVLDGWSSRYVQLAEAGLVSASITWFLTAGTVPS